MKKLIFLSIVIAILNPLIAGAITKFSIDPGSPSIDGNITPDDVLGPGPVVHTEGRNLGLTDNFFGGVFDNLADFSFGKDPIKNPLYFSVDRVAVGLPGTAVFNQAQPGIASAAGDVYVALPPFRNNSLVINEVALGLTPGFLGDDLDGLELDSEPSPNVYFAIDRLSATNGFGAGTLASDLLVSARDGHFSLYASNASMGLHPGDAIDGLVLLDIKLDQKADSSVDKALFSLDPFSPDTFTFTGLSYIPCVPGHISPADVCVTDFTGTFSLWASAADIGLGPSDNVDALDTVPEPGSYILLSSGLIGLWIWRRSKHAQVILKKRVRKMLARQKFLSHIRLPKERFNCMIAVLSIAALAQNAAADEGPFFVGESPPVLSSNATLLLKEDVVNERVFRWKSSDSILGNIDIGFVPASTWRYFPTSDTSPARLVFIGGTAEATFYGNVIFEPYSRAVVDVVSGSH